MAVVLGSSAGGGFPQWNCTCVCCRAVRDGSRPTRRRTQSSLAVRADGGPWYLANASPDVTTQLEALPATPSAGPRNSPFAGILLTDAELDHTLGLFALREASRPLALFGAPLVRHALGGALPVLPLLERWCGVRWSDLEPGCAIKLEGGLTVEPWVTGHRPPRYLSEPAPGPAVFGLTFTVPGAALTYAPGLSALDDETVARLGASDCALVDGTCWHDDDLARAGVGSRRARDMGHLPLAGAGGALDVLAGLDDTRVVLVHVNNTNPVLLEDSPERRELEARGLEVAEDGLTVTLPA